jgi:hypothetical protein
MLAGGGNGADDTRINQQCSVLAKRIYPGIDASDCALPAAGNFP